MKTMQTILFKTNIKKWKAAINVSNLIPLYFKEAKVELDLVQDKFRMLISGPKLKPAKIIHSMNQLGYKFKVEDKLTLWQKS